MSRRGRRALLYGAGLAVAGGLVLLSARDPGPDPATLLHGASLLAGLGHTDEALAACDRVLGEDPGNLEARVFRATFLAAAGRHDEALRAYDDAIARAKEDDMRASLILDRASVLLRAGRKEGFQRERDRLAAMGAGYRLDLCEGIAAESEGAWGAAVAAYDRALEARPDDEQAKACLYAALLRLGGEALAKGSFDDARADFDRAVLLCPRSTEARLRAAEVRLATRDVKGAIEQLRAAGPRARGVGPLAFRAATLLLEAGRREEALDALAAALVADGKGTRALLQNETLWRPELSHADVREILETTQSSTRAVLTADGGVIDDQGTAGSEARKPVSPPG
jgi:tetratricopeptide (TPR) repeat protein